jgi:hypothetical protein
VPVAQRRGGGAEEEQGIFYVVEVEKKVIVCVRCECFAGLHKCAIP